MTDLSYVDNSISAGLGLEQIKTKTLSSTLSAIKQDWRYLAAIFGALLIWQIVVMAVYSQIDTPTVAGSQRAYNFAVLLIFRVGLFLFFLMIVRLVQSALKSGDQSVLTYINAARKQDPYKPLRALGFFALAVISFVWLQTCFMSLKTAFPEFIPFYLDETARDLDRLLFFGRDPYTLFDWVLDSPVLMSIIDRLYTYWAALIAGFWVYCFATERMDKNRRYQYIIAMMLLWFIAGNVLAAILSSAGPCYYEVFTGDATTYAPLMAQLDAINAVKPLGAVQYHDVLMQMYNTPEMRFGGISAMPSLHVGASLMLLVLFWKTRIARELLILFNIIIYIGSIVLGWHYAIDGLIVLPIVFGCWWVAGKLVNVLSVDRKPTLIDPKAA